MAGMQARGVFDSIAFPNPEYTSGARADVLVYSPWVWYKPNAQKTVSDVTGYVMVDANTDAPTDYFQAGWIEFAKDSSWHSPGNYGSDDTWWLGVDYQQALYSDHFSVWDPACAQ